MERSWTPLGPPKYYRERLLDGPKPPRRSVSACLGAKWAPKRSPRRVPNRDPKAIRAENGKTLFFNDSCKDFNDFSGVRALFEGPKVGPKWGPNRIFDAEALEYLLGASWIALGALRSRKKVIAISSWAAKRRAKTRFHPTKGIRPGQHWERKAHHHAIERSDRFCASCEEINPIAL